MHCLLKFCVIKTISLSQNAFTAKRDSQKMYAAAKQLEAEHGNRLAKIQSELQALHVKQKQLAQVLIVPFQPSFVT